MSEGEHVLTVKLSLSAVTTPDVVVEALFLPAAVKLSTVHSLGWGHEDDIRVEADTG